MRYYIIHLFMALLSGVDQTVGLHKVRDQPNSFVHGGIVLPIDTSSCVLPDTLHQLESLAIKEQSSITEDSSPGHLVEFLVRLRVELDRSDYICEYNEPSYNVLLVLAAKRLIFKRRFGLFEPDSAQAFAELSLMKLMSKYFSSVANQSTATRHAAKCWEELGVDGSCQLPDYFLNDFREKSLGSSRWDARSWE